MKGRSRELLLGQLIGQLALLLAIPVLTRLLSTSEMGIYQSGFSIALILQPLATLRRELLIPVTDGQTSLRHRTVGLKFAALCSGITTFISIPLGFAGYRSLAELSLVTGLILMSLAIISIENAYLIRHSQFRRLAARNLLAGTLSAILQIAAAFFIPTSFAVAASLLIGRALATFITMAHIKVQTNLNNKVEQKPQHTISAILSAVMASASSQAVIVGSLGLLGPAAAAQIGVGQRIGGTPTSLIGQALSQIALGNAAPLLRDKLPGLTHLLRRQMLQTGSAASLMAVVLMIAAPLLAEPLLGPGWHQAGVLTAVFAIPLSLQLVALPPTTLLVPMGYERRLLALQTFRFIIIALTMATAAGLSKADIFITCLATAIAWTLAYIPIISAAFIATRKHDKECS